MILILIMEDYPAPRPMESNPLMAYEYVPLFEDSLQSGLGCIPGETESERVELKTDNLISGRGVIP